MMAPEPFCLYLLSLGGLSQDPTLPTLDPHCLLLSLSLITVNATSHNSLPCPSLAMPPTRK